MDTVAVYREKPVRTYGVRARGGLFLARLGVPPGGLERLSWALSNAQPPLDLVACGAVSGGEGPGLNLCLPTGQKDRLAKLSQEAGARLEDSQEVELISLQGPHFGDRWGIASEALAGLGEAGVEPLMLLGVVHTLQLLVGREQASLALRGLRRRFWSPEDGHA